MLAVNSQDQARQIFILKKSTSSTYVFMKINSMDVRAEFLFHRSSVILGDLLPTMICLILAGLSHIAVITWVAFVPHLWPKTHHHRQRFTRDHHAA